MAPVNYLAIFVAALLSMVLGSLWYGPIFGKPWMKMMGMNKESMKGVSSSEMGKLYGIQFLGSLVMAYVLAITAGQLSPFWIWLGFVAPVTLTTVLWEGKPWKLWLLNNGYFLILLMMMGTVLTLWS